MWPILTTLMCTKVTTFQMRPHLQIDLELIDPKALQGDPSHIFLTLTKT